MPADALATWWNPPADPERDLWWAAHRIAAPDVDDHATRHRRGVVRLPYDLGPNSGGMAGDLVEAWVCCDPACGGVELGECVLHINHFCCGRDTFIQRRCKAPSGAYHGPFTAHWEPAP